MKKSYDVLGLGCTAVDEILYVPSYPEPDGKVEVRQRERHCGGLSATALVAVARLGGQCAYAGTLGSDEASQFVIDTLRREGVDVSALVRRPGTGPVRSVIVVDERRRTRNIFYHTQLSQGAAATLPARSIIASARVLLVDRFGIPGMIRAARMARASGVPVVADFESSGLPRFNELLALSDHLILSQEFACRLTRTRSPQAAADRLWRADRSVVVITAGSAGYWFKTAAAELAGHRAAFRVVARDTTGCGDVFHGAYALALAREMPLEERLRFASAAAALKATKRGGQAGIPTAPQVRTFLAGVQSSTGSSGRRAHRGDGA